MSVRSIFNHGSGSFGGEEVMPSFSTMQSHTPLLKYGQQGNPHFRYFYLNKSKTSLIWHSHKKKSAPTKVDISTMLRLERGQKSDIFRRNSASKSHPEHLSFSLYYKSGDNEKTLDIVCKDQMEFDIWVRGLVYLIKNKEQIIEEAGDMIDDDDDNFDEALKLVNVKLLKEQMHAHLDLCTWGSSQWGQLGHCENANELKNENNPKKVRYLIDHDVALKFVDCGDCHTVAVSKTGECYSWGNSNSGRLGVIVGASNSAEDVNSGAAMAHVLLPQVIVGLRGIPIQTVACGNAHTLFVTDDQRLYATGSNISGQLGTGDKSDHMTPVTVSLPPGVKVLSASAGELFSAVVAMHDGETKASCAAHNYLYTWGANIYGNLGHGDLETRLTPTRVESLAITHSVDSVSCGASHMAIIATDLGKTFVSHDIQEDDLLVDEDEVKMERLSSGIFKESEMYRDDTSNKRVVLMTCGWGACGQLGHGDFSDLCSAKEVDFYQSKYSPVKVSCGAGHTACILQSKNEGRVLYMWGLGSSVSKNGEENAADKSTPVWVDNMTLLSANHSKNAEFDLYNIIQDIACGDMYTLILTGEGLMHLYGKLSPSMMGNVNRIEDYSDYGPKSVASGGCHLTVLLSRKWVKDEDSDKCMNCSREFTFVNRIHHCRSCGGSFCGDCSKKRCPVLKFGYQEPVRVCDRCHSLITGM